MEKPLSPIAKFFMFIFAFLLVFVLPISILAYDVGRVVFNEELVTDVVTEVTTESELIPGALEWFSERRADQRYASGEAQAWVGEPDVVMLIDFMNADDWRVVRWEVLPNEILAEWVAETVHGTYDWIDSQDTVPQITWDMVNFVARVNTEHGVNAIIVAYDALPPCEPEQVEDFKNRLAAAPAGTEVLYNLCEFPEPWYEDQFSDYVESLEGIVANIPGKFALTEELGDLEDTAGVGPALVKSQLRFLRTLMRWSIFVPMVLLILILIFGIRSLKGLGRWWGIPLILGGLLALILGLAYRPLITWALAMGPLSEAPPLITEEATLATLRLAAEIFRPVLWQSLVIVIISLIIVLITVAIKPKKTPPVVEPTVEPKVEPTKEVLQDEEIAQAEEVAEE